MIAGLRVAVECEECGDDEFVYEDDCGRWLCQACAINIPCEDDTSVSFEVEYMRMIDKLGRR